MRRSKHSLSSTHLTSLDMGFLYPVNTIEVLPGDSFQVSTAALIRLAPMLAPPMHPVQCRIHHWFVPFRLVWDEWENFITGGPDGLSAPAFPKIYSQPCAVGTLSNYLGLPVTSPANLPEVSALPFRAYQLIWNEYYRDQDLQTKAAMITTSGMDGSTVRDLQRVCWPKDYFTVARPWEQKGPSVSIPGVNGQVLGLGVQTTVPPTSASQTIFQSDGSTVTVPVVSTSFMETLSAGSVTGANRPNVRVESDGAITVNQLRESLAIQRFEEARAMYGSRYTEYLRALGVRSSDARLQRPEYLGGGVQTIQFSEIVQSAQDGTTPVGTLRGHGINAMRSNKFRRFFEEHGYVMTMVSILPKSIYMDGVQKTFLRETKYDFWQRELENLGQQPIKNVEIYAKHTVPDGTFGYTDRYDEYRRQWSRVTGEFATSALDYWHFARSFASEPALNSTFVSSNPTTRPFASTTTDVIYAQFHHSVQARRLVSKFATPKTF